MPTILTPNIDWRVWVAQLMACLILSGGDPMHLFLVATRFGCVDMITCYEDIASSLKATLPHDAYRKHNVKVYTYLIISAGAQAGLIGAVGDHDGLQAFAQLMAVMEVALPGQLDRVFTSLINYKFMGDPIALFTHFSRCKNSIAALDQPLSDKLTVAIAKAAIRASQSPRWDMFLAG